MERIYIPGIGWMSKFITIYKILDDFHKQALIKECVNPISIKLPKWELYNCN